MKFQAAVIRDRADKGVFLTTSLFTKPAKLEASNGACQIELIDIERLMDLIEQFALGVQPQVSYAIDDVFFAEFAPKEDQVK
jgi:restriction system protein